MGKLQKVRTDVVIYALIESGLEPAVHPVARLPGMDRCWVRKGGI